MTTQLDLSAERRLHVAKYAKGALVAAGALGRIPTPLDDVTEALELSTPEDLFQLADAPPGLMMRLRRLKSKVIGAFAVRERIIYLDTEQPPTKLRFTQGHELGHRALPWHDEAYYGDDDRALHPDTTDSWRPRLTPSVPSCSSTKTSSPSERTPHGSVWHQPSNSPIRSGPLATPPFDATSKAHPARAP